MLSGLDVSRRSLGAALMTGSVLVVAVALVASAALAPPIASTPASNGSATTLVGVQSTTTDGRLAALGPRGGERWSYANAASYHDVTPLPNGTVLATFVAHDDRPCGPYEAPCSRTGVRIVDPKPEPHVVFEWAFPVRTSKNSEVHDAELLPSGELLVADMDRERVFTVAPNGTVTWQWSASSFYDAPPDPTKTDWLHINDVDRLAEGRYLVSVRNANQLVIVERGEGVVDVINEDGDPRVLNKQHNPQMLGSDAVLVADSENDRVVELHERNGEWEVAWQVDSAGGVRFDWPRDADRLPNGNTLVTDSRNNRVVELNASGDVVWSARVPTVPYEADRPPGEYPAGDPYESDGATGVGAEGAGSAGGPLGSGDLPVFSYLVDSARHVVALPYWLSGWHLALGSGASVAFLAGLVLFVRSE
ncbi:arylsulfotransferase family protein [Halomicrococcus sp. SG-WS-1]|uniref:arylsulfotransferase family protein n=1 Tax=Halomicrococcus sp. SG-WS-1 TaxID=3439057 RepID=UPI003F78C1BE